MRTVTLFEFSSGNIMWTGIVGGNVHFLCAAAVTDTSDWINQQIDEIPQGFDISSNILCDQISEKGTSIPR